jgi:hypothetical protein
MRIHIRRTSESRGVEPERKPLLTFTSPFYDHAPIVTRPEPASRGR